MKNRNEKNKGKRIVKKVLLSILGIFVIMMVAGIVTITSLISCIKKEYKPDETIVGSGEKKALIIYEPSKSNVAKEVTMSVAQSMKDAGYTVTINYPSKELSYNLEGYDIIAFGSPVYCGSVSSALKEYVQSNQIENKNVFIYSIGAADDTKELEEMSSWASNNNNIVKAKCITKDKDTFYSFVKKTMTVWDTSGSMH